MKKIIFLLMAAIAIALQANAQRPDSLHVKKHLNAGHQFKKIHSRIEDSLNLSATQQQQWKANAQQFRSQAQAIKNDAALKKDDKKNRLKALSAQFRSQQVDILNDEQKAKLKSLDKNKWGKQHKNNAAIKSKLAATLQFTDAQKAKAKAIDQDFGKKLQALRRDSTVAGQQKKEQLHHWAQQRTQALEAIMTADQKAKMDSLRNNAALWHAKRHK